MAPILFSIIKKQEDIGSDLLNLPALLFNLTPNIYTFKHMVGLWYIIRKNCREETCEKAMF
jgi:hypothetical protein